MVELIRSNPAMGAYRKGIAAGDLARVQEEQERAAGLRNAAAEASVINAARLDRNVGAAGLRTPSPASPSAPMIPQPPASGVAVTGLRGGGGGDAILVPPPAATTGLRTAGAGPSARDRLAGAYMNSPGYRAQGAEMMVGAEDAALAKEEAELKQVLTMATKDPQAAIAWAQGNGIDLPPAFQQILSSRGFAAQAEQLYAQAEQFFPGGHNIKKRVQWYLSQLQGLKEGMTRPAAGGPTPAGATASGQPAAEILPENAPVTAPSRITTDRGIFEWVNGDWQPISYEGKILQPSTTERGRGASVFEQKREAYLTVYPGDEEGALAYASGRKQVSKQEEEKWAHAMAVREAAASYENASDPNFIENRVKEILAGWRQKSSAPTAAVGTEADPIIAKTQADIDSAPSGSILIVNGQKFRKP